MYYNKPVSTEYYFWSKSEEQIAYETALTIFRAEDKDLDQIIIALEKLEFARSRQHAKATNLLINIIKDYCDKASEKDVNALFLLGVCFREGYGVNKEPEKAVVCYKTVLELDPQHSYALLYMAECYYFGYGVKKDRGMAVLYYMQSAELDNKTAKAILNGLQVI